MAKYLLTWDIEPSRMPNSPAEIATGWKMLAGLVKKDFETGKMKDWGSFPGERRGYSVLEGSEQDLMRVTMQYAPFVNFEIHQVSSIDDVIEFLSSVK